MMTLYLICGILLFLIIFWAEFRNIDRFCEKCGKSIHFWQSATNAFTGRYHNKCFYAKDKLNKKDSK